MKKFKFENFENFEKIEIQGTNLKFLISLLVNLGAATFFSVDPSNWAAVKEELDGEFDGESPWIKLFKSVDPNENGKAGKREEKVGDKTRS